MTSKAISVTFSSSASCLNLRQCYFKTFQFWSGLLLDIFQHKNRNHTDPILTMHFIEHVLEFKPNCSACSAPLAVMGGSCGKFSASFEQPQVSKVCMLSARSACRTTATTVDGPRLDGPEGAARTSKDGSSQCMTYARKYTELSRRSGF